MSVWNSLSSNNKIVVSLEKFFSSVFRTNFGVTRKNNIYNLEIGVFPPIKPYLWTCNVIDEMLQLSGNYNKAGQLTKTCDKKLIRENIFRFGVGSFFYALTKMEKDNPNCMDVNKNMEVLKQISDDKVMVFFTGTLKVLNMLCTEVKLVDLQIPTWIGTGNVKNKKDQKVGRLIITVKPEIQTSTYYDILTTCPEKEYFKDFFVKNSTGGHNIDVSFSKIKFDLYFMKNLMNNKELLNRFGNLELVNMTVETDPLVSNPILSYFTVQKENGEIYEYTLNSTPDVNIYSMCVSLILGIIPLDLTKPGENLMDISTNYLNNRNGNISNSDFTNDILQKFYYISKIDGSRNLEEIKDSVPIVLSLSEVHKSVVVFLFCGLSEDGDIQTLFPNIGSGPSGPKPKPNKPGPNKDKNKSEENENPKVKESSQSEDKLDGNIDQNPSKDESINLSNTQLFLGESETDVIDKEHVMDLVEVPDNKSPFGRFFKVVKIVGGTAVNVGKIVAPNMGRALDLGYKTYKLLSKREKPIVNFTTNNTSLVGNMNNDISVIPGVRFPRLTNR